MKYKLSLLLLSSAVFCPEPKTKWVKEDSKCPDRFWVGCTADEINESPKIQEAIDKLASQVKAEDNQSKKDELNHMIENLEKKKCRLSYIGTEDPKKQFPNGSWVKYDRETCKMTSKPCPHQNDPELADDCIFNSGVSISEGN
jgi:hypothetical protein